MFNRQHTQFSMTELDHYLSGFLAISVDSEIEVQKAAAETLWSCSVGLGSQWIKEMVSRLVYRFVSTALHSIQRTSSTAHFGGITNSLDMSVMVPALEGIINFEELCRSVSIGEAIEIEIGPHLVAFLVATLAALLEKSEISKDRTGANRLSHLLRALGSSKYRQHIIYMMSSQLYEGMALAKWHSTSAFVSDEVLGLMERVNVLVVLKGIYVALERENAASDRHHKSLKNTDVGDVEACALRHMIENLQIPPSLVSAIPETRDKILEEKFVNTSYYFLKIAEAILKAMSTDMICGDIIQDLILSCSALASPKDNNFSWIRRDIQELASGIVSRLGIMFIEAQEQTSKVKTEAGMYVEKLISTLLPDLILKLKSYLKDHLRENDDGNYDNVSSSFSLATAVIASHQLYWCVKQVIMDAYNKKITVQSRGKTHILDVKLKGESIPIVSASAITSIMKKHLFAYLVFARDVLESDESNLSVLDKERSMCLQHFSDCFPDSLPSRLPPEDPRTHAIDLVPGSSPSNRPPYRVSVAQLEEIMSRIEELLEKGLIQPSLSPFCSRVLLVLKKDG
ncbi:hypothetical protein L7F22_048883 [Adiantum nelumboides]|nr:hypothetical protein [Adiantum nelumboides]